MFTYDIFNYYHFAGFCMIVAEPISMSTPQMSYVNENSQSNMKEQRRDNNYNKRQFICRILQAYM